MQTFLPGPFNDVPRRIKVQGVCGADQDAGRLCPALQAKYRQKLHFFIDLPPFFVPLNKLVFGTNWRAESQILAV